MKVGFPLKNEKELAKDFAHSQLIGVYDEYTGTSSFYPINESTVSNQQYIFEQMLNHGLAKVASPFYSFMSLRVFKENNIVTYKAKGYTLDDNILLFQTGKMTPFDIYESLLTGDCAKDCKSCDPNECE
jgi:predicted Fe-Mo cluster-binding NifX family protein